MADFNGQYSTTTVQDASIDAGLRQFMLGIYNKMGLGLVLTGILAWATSSIPEVRDILFRVVNGRFAGYTIIGMAVTFAPVVVLLGAGFIMRNPTAATTAGLYWLTVGLIGLSTGANFLIYTGASIASTFFITAATFGALSLLGYTTKKDLSAMGKFLFMAVIGLIIASVVNIFMQSSMFFLIINVLGVLIFAGLIAYDTQNLKRTYYSLGGNEAGMAMATNYGALSLYINFINMFQFLLALFGSRR
jgi:uncharacterized protein